MSTSNNVPNGIITLTSEDWSDILSSLDEAPRIKLINLVKTKLKSKQKNSKKRSLNDLDDDENEDIDLNTTSNSNSMEPPKKKLKTDDTICDESIDAICNKLIEEAIKDGIKKFVVGGLILNDNNEILVLQRAKNEFMPNIYEIPSGTKDPSDNTLIDCLSREVKEESGLKLKKVLKFVNTFDYKSSSGKATRQFNFCIIVESTENVIISDEHQAFGWIKQHQLFEKESEDNKYNDIVSKCTPLVRDTMRKGFKTFAN